MNGQAFLRKYRFATILLAIMTIATVIVLSIDHAPPKDAPELDGLLMAVLIAVGLVAGLLGGWIGTGGCSVMLPILSFWLGFPAALAVGTTLFAVIFTAISGGYGHFKQKNVDRRATLWTGGAGILGVILGSWLFLYLSAESELLGFAIGLIFLLPSLRMIWEGFAGYRANKSASRVPPPPQDQSIGGSPTQLATLGTSVGVLTGVVGLGGGYALVPGFIYLFRAPVYITMGTSLAVIIPMAMVGGSIKLAQGYVFLGAGLLLAMGAIVGAQIGAATIKKFKPYTLKLIFGIYFLYVAVKFIGNFVGIRVW